MGCLRSQDQPNLEKTAKHIKSIPVLKKMIYIYNQLKRRENRLRHTFAQESKMPGKSTSDCYSVYDITEENFSVFIYTLTDIFFNIKMWTKLSFFQESLFSKRNYHAWIAYLKQVVLHQLGGACFPLHLLPFQKYQKLVPPQVHEISSWLYIK